ncbi:encapsulin-associated ferritin-like protein [Microaceticoccus formicicus]|uniref:encapsulin-associated ferritin-like protein n=1 Tax=Microaceticoccus formicicus TaxID=3118105 RepID=UPI003CD02C7E|nr:ferritin-like domain-containing protein [Peptoniphilaceae bacterium AMB_02]
MASDYHEDINLLSEEDKNFVRALNSLKEEIEAVDWYHQRVAASNDEELKEIMKHNAIEEMEHAAMTLEWLRRNMYGWDEQLKTYLFTEENILEVEEQGESAEESQSSEDLGIGEL